MTLARRDLRSFLGKRNFKGIYSRNPLSKTPAYAMFRRSTMYPTSYPFLGKFRIDANFVNWKEFFSKETRASSRPFAQNPYTKSNKLVPSDLLEAILTDHQNGHSSQRISFKFGMAVPRVEALIKLNEIKNSMQRDNQITNDMRKYARAMRGLFQTISTSNDALPTDKVDDLTEIPIPSEVRTQRFLSLAESEPFGPIDAAKVLGIEPASETLKKLSEGHDEAEQPNPEAQGKRRTRESVAFVAPVRDGEKSQFRFTAANVGQVGYRYGASRDDTKHARQVRFLPNGHMTYPEPISSGRKARA